MPRILRPTGMRSYRPFSGAGGEVLSISSGGGGSFAQEIAADSPTIWMPMDETSGTTAAQDGSLDRTGSINPGGSFLYAQTGLVADGGTSLYLDGSSSVYNSYVATDWRPTSFTMECAMKLDAVGAAWQNCITYGDQGIAAVAGWHLRSSLTSGYFAFEWYTGAWQSVTSTTAPVAGQSAWWSFEIEFSSQTFNIYKNGTLAEAVGLPVTTIPSGTYDSRPWIFGARLLNTALYLPATGYFDNGVAFDGLLGATRILAHAQAGGFA